MQKITPFLWFDSQAEEAATVYVSLFDDAEYHRNLALPRGRTRTDRRGDDGQLPPGGPGVHALNGGPQFSFTEAVSFAVACEDQEEVDRLWDALIEGGGEPSQCGGPKNRFGLSRQIIPIRRHELLDYPDPARRSGDAGDAADGQDRDQGLEDAADAA